MSTPALAPPPLPPPPSDPGFGERLNTVRSHGVTDDQVLDHLSNSPTLGPKIIQARQAGVPAGSILGRIQEVSEFATAPTHIPEATSPAPPPEGFIPATIHKTQQNMSLENPLSGLRRADQMMTPSNGSVLPDVSRLIPNPDRPNEETVGSIVKNLIPNPAEIAMDTYHKITSGDYSGALSNILPFAFVKGGPEAVEGAKPYVKSGARATADYVPPAAKAAYKSGVASIPKAKTQIGIGAGAGSVLGGIIGHLTGGGPSSVAVDAGIGLLGGAPTILNAARKGAQESIRNTRDFRQSRSLAEQDRQSRSQPRNPATHTDEGMKPPPSDDVVDPDIAAYEARQRARAANPNWDAPPPTPEPAPAPPAQPRRRASHVEEELPKPPMTVDPDIAAWEARQAAREADPNWDAPPPESTEAPAPPMADTLPEPPSTSNTGPKAGKQTEEDLTGDYARRHNIAPEVIRQMTPEQLKNLTDLAKHEAKVHKVAKSAAGGFKPPPSDPVVTPAPEATPTPTEAAPAATPAAEGMTPPPGFKRKNVINHDSDTTNKENNLHAYFSAKEITPAKLDAMSEVEKNAEIVKAYDWSVEQGLPVKGRWKPIDAKRGSDAWDNAVEKRRKSYLPKPPGS